MKLIFGHEIVAHVKNKIEMFFYKNLFVNSVKYVNKAFSLQEYKVGLTVKLGKIGKEGARNYRFNSSTNKILTTNILLIKNEK